MTGEVADEKKKQQQQIKQRTGKNNDETWVGVVCPNNRCGAAWNLMNMKVVLYLIPLVNLIEKEVTFA